MTAERWQQLKGVLHNALQREPPARAAFLDQACAGDPVLRSEVEVLLDSSERAGDFFELPALELAAHALAGARPESLLGKRAGPYQILSLLGAGGMGDVYRAERTDGAYVGRAAIKLMRMHLRDADSARRFQTERQILASLQHANIVTLLDGGTTAEGQEYLAMELVEGTAVSQFCRARQLGLEARVGLMQQVCDAVQYAHQRGIVHRDLKPTNILVTAEGVPKILDFGIAKLLEGPAGLPATQASVLGPLTPNYASPEQLRGLPVTTASDVYSLGMLLYEVLGGARPYETTGMTLEAMLSTVVDTQPARPSQSTAVDGDPLPYPRRRLRGDLDAIVLKALRKEPERRYGSAGALADDLGRVVRGEPVIARDPSAGYLLRRLASRHRAAVAVAAAACLAVLLAMGVALWQRQAALDAQAQAENRFRDIRQLSNALIFKLHDSVAKLPGSTPVRRQIVDEALGYLERLAAESANDPALQLELGAAHRRIASILGDPSFPNLGDVQGALVEANKSLQLLQAGAEARAGGVTQPALASLVDTHILLSRLYSAAGDRAKAVAMVEGAARISRGAADLAQPDGQSRLARVTFSLASIAQPLEAKIPHWQQAGRLYEALLAEQPDDPVRQRHVALVGRNFGGLLVALKRPDEARTHFERALALDEQRLAAAPDNRMAQLDTTIEYSQLAGLMEDDGDYARALALHLKSLALRETLAESDSQDVLTVGRAAWTRMKVARMQLALGDVPAALVHARRSVAELDRLMKGTPTRRTASDFGAALETLGEAEWAGGARASACRQFARATAVLTTNHETRNEARDLEPARANVERCP